MAQVTTGIHAILSVPFFYELFQKIMGADKARKKFVADFVDGFGVKVVLDIGCGPAELLAYMPGVEYYGYDISEDYIDRARRKFGDKGRFFARDISASEIELLPKFDLVIMHGLLHHVDDEHAVELLDIARRSLQKGGRVVTVDGCLVEGQNPVARYLIEHDRGRNVRSKDGYLELAKQVFSDVEAIIYHKRWIPYTLCYLQCRRTDTGS